MHTINATANQLAGIIIVDEKLTKFIDAWRNKNDVTIEVNFEEYKEFLQKYAYLLSRLSAGTEFFDLPYPVQYDRFVRDIMLAQIQELHIAGKQFKPATTITPVVNAPTNKLAFWRLPEEVKQVVQYQGTSHVHRMSTYLRTLVVQSNDTPDGRNNQALYTKTLRTIGYALYHEVHNRGYLWTLL